MNSYIIDLVLSPVVQFRMYNKGGSVEIYIIYQCSQEIEYIKYEYSNFKKKMLLTTLSVPLASSLLG